MDGAAIRRLPLLRRKFANEEKLTIGRGAALLLPYFLLIAFHPILSYHKAENFIFYTKEMDDVN